MVHRTLGAHHNSTNIQQKQQGRAFGAPHRGAERPCGCCFCFMLVELWCAPRVLCTKNSVHQDPCSPLWAQSCPVGRFLKAFTNIEAKFEKVLKNDTWIFQGPVSRKNETVACVRTAAKFRFELRAGRIPAIFLDPIREGRRLFTKSTFKSR